MKIDVKHLGRFLVLFVILSICCTISFGSSEEFFVEDEYLQIESEAKIDFEKVAIKLKELGVFAYVVVNKFTPSRDVDTYIQKMLEDRIVKSGSEKKITILLYVGVDSKDFSILQVGDGEGDILELENEVFSVLSGEGLQESIAYYYERLESRFIPEMEVAGKGVSFLWVVFILLGGVVIGVVLCGLFFVINVRKNNNHESRAVVRPYLRKGRN